MRDTAQVTFEPTAASIVRRMQEVGADVRVVDASFYFENVPPNRWLVVLYGDGPLSVLDVLDRIERERADWSPMFDDVIVHRADDGVGWMAVFRQLRGKSATLH